ncbi:hypothetical protein FFK22_008815 [Mycobacterium sp. KBS0706]|uniref:hypothetical protein n=1 Tax=Mycobacterium sp. KBS0706 TaxID=2578109 RepID=UPI00110F8CA7|nr:hypothetical protein [Mycobacterium sp. KBS0706]TSD89072.1 hypothetical protein FFK22_008815 [Mycobacterium sp. KBS0706]
MKIEVVSLGIVKRDGSPDIHYLPGTYEVADDVATALREQGALAPKPEAPTGDAEMLPTGRKGKGA